MCLEYKEGTMKSCNCSCSVSFTGFVGGMLVFVYVYCLLILLSNDIETNIGPPTKVCPACSSNVHIRKMTCSCGYSFKKQKSHSEAYST